jgi:hypothetical protein
MVSCHYCRGQFDWDLAPDQLSGGFSCALCRAYRHLRSLLFESGIPRSIQVELVNRVRLASGDIQDLVERSGLVTRVAPTVVFATSFRPVFVGAHQAPGGVTFSSGGTGPGGCGGSSVPFGGSSAPVHSAAPTPSPTGSLASVASIPGTVSKASSPAAVKEELPPAPDATPPPVSVTPITPPPVHTPLAPQVKPGFPLQPPLLASQEVKSESVAPHDAGTGGDLGGSVVAESEVDRESIPDTVYSWRAPARATSSHSPTPPVIAPPAHLLPRSRSPSSDRSSHSSGRLSFDQDNEPPKKKKKSSKGKKKRERGFNYWRSVRENKRGDNRRGGPPPPAAGLA